LAILFKPFGFIAPEALCFLKLSNLSIMSVSDEGYSEARRAH
jgi:hypothetical protein